MLAFRIADSEAVECGCAAPSTTALGSSRPAAPGEQLAGVAGADVQKLGRARRRARDERLELGVALGDLGVERLDPAREGSQRKLGGQRGLIKITEGGTQPATQLGLAADRPAQRKLFA